MNPFPFISCSIILRHISPHTSYTSPHASYTSPHASYTSPHASYTSPHTSPFQSIHLRS